VQHLDEGGAAEIVAIDNDHTGEGMMCEALLGGGKSRKEGNRGNETEPDESGPIQNGGLGSDDPQIGDRN